MREANRLVGTASFAPSPEGLLYQEDGVLVGGGFRSPASQSYRFLTEGPRASVRFRDGRLFHELDLACGAAHVRHACAPDMYRGRYRVRGANLWTSAWRVDGPRKQLLIVTRYRRPAA